MDQQAPKTRKVAEIEAAHYVLRFRTEGGEITVICDPTAADIERAIENEAYETRDFQSHLGELNQEWESASPVECCCKARLYHARRIAYFVVNGWQGDPITLNPDGSLNDGLHRWRAARHLALEEVEVKIAGAP